LIVLAPVCPGHLPLSTCFGLGEIGGHIEAFAAEHGLPVVS
jgi:hypothetical protein